MVDVTRKFKFPLENWWWGILVFAITVVLLPLFLLSQLPHPELGEPFLLVLTSVLYSGGHLALLALGGSEKLLSLTFWLFAYVWLGITPLVQFAIGDFPWEAGIYSEDTLVKAVLIVLAGYVAYDLGSWLGNRCDGRFVNRIVPAGLTFSKRRIYLLAPLAVAIALFAIFNLGGFQAIFAFRSSFGNETVSEFGKGGAVVWYSLLRWPTLVALLLALWAWLNRGRLHIVGWERLLVGVLISVLLIFTLVIDNPVRSPRFVVGVVILSLAFVLLRWNRRRSMGLWIVGFSLALLLIFPYADLFRHEDTILALQSVTEQLAFNGDYDALQIVANTVEFVSAEGLTFGWQLLGVLLFWVPRAIWPGKPIGTGELIAEYSGFSFTNTPASLWAEAYINGGMILVVLIFLMYGALSSLLQNKYLDPRGSPLSIVTLLVPLLAAYQIFFIRGELIGTFAYLMPILGYLFLAVKRSPLLPKNSASSVTSHRSTVGQVSTYSAGHPR